MEFLHKWINLPNKCRFDSVVHSATLRPPVKIMPEMLQLEVATASCTTRRCSQVMSSITPKTNVVCDKGRKQKVAAQLWVQIYRHVLSVKHWLSWQNFHRVLCLWIAVLGLRSSWSLQPAKCPAYGKQVICTTTAWWDTLKIMWPEFRDRIIGWKVQEWQQKCGKKCGKKEHQRTQATDQNPNSPMDLNSHRLRHAVPKAQACHAVEVRLVFQGFEDDFAAFGLGPWEFGVSAWGTGLVISWISNHDTGKDRHLGKDS